MISTWLEFRKHRGARSLLAVILVFSLIPGADGLAKAPDPDPVCNPAADYFLGNEDYPEAVRLHLLVVHQHPEDALAHYHLGFSEGMMGDSRGEIAQYRQAAALGLKDWDLYLNLGRALLEKSETGPAVSALQQAVALGPDHSGGSLQSRPGLRTARAARRRFVGIDARSRARSFASRCW